MDLHENMAESSHAQTASAGDKRSENPPHHNLKHRETPAQRSRRLKRNAGQNVSLRFNINCGNYTLLSSVVSRQQ